MLVLVATAFPLSFVVLKLEANPRVYSEASRNYLAFGCAALALLPSLITASTSKLFKLTVAVNVVALGTFLVGLVLLT